jgi:hypothetical protein
MFLQINAQELIAFEVLNVTTGFVERVGIHISFCRVPSPIPSDD